MAGATRPTVSGLYFFNLHDGPRFNAASDWRFEHSWGDYTRDDCIENDKMASGVIYDVLLDGCYAGYSNRPTSSVDGSNNTVTFEKVLLRMEMMPGPYQACAEKAHWYFDANRDPYTDSPCVEREVYGTGNLFKLAKWDDAVDPPGGLNPTFNLIDSMFIVDQVRSSSE